MRKVSLCVFVVFSFVTVEFAHSQVPPNKSGPYVGQIIIVGNEVTRDRVIRAVVQTCIQPGQVLNFKKLRLVEKRLAAMGLFELDPKKGMKPTVQIIEDPNPKSKVKDILVSVQDTNTSCIRLDMGLSFRAEPIIRLVWEERNFDPLRFPTCWSEIVEGKAFRGDGQQVQIEVIRFSLARGCVSFFSREALLFEPFRGSR